MGNLSLFFQRPKRGRFPWLCRVGAFGQWALGSNHPNQRGGGEVVRLVKPTLAAAKHALDLLLGANTPEIPADRGATDPWLGVEDLHQEILRSMQQSPEFAEQLLDEVEDILKDSPEGSSPFEN